MGDNELDENVRDHLTAVAKSALGAVPVAGSFLAELAGSVIPEQRVDRLVKFTKDLAHRLSDVDREFLKSQVSNANFVDLNEEAMRQAVRALSDERREYIANLVANGIRAEDLEYSESKHLLRILGELNDFEILWLRRFVDPVMDSDNEFREKHAEVFEPAVATIGGARRERDKAALQASYHEHLRQLGLVEPRFKLDRSTKLPVFDHRTGAPEVLRYDVTPLGWLLLREIGLWHDAA